MVKDDIKFLCIRFIHLVEIIMQILNSILKGGEIYQRDDILKKLLHIPTFTNKNKNMKCF